MKTLDDVLAVPKDRPVCTVLIDGDIPAFRCSAVVDGRMYCVKDQKGAWKYKKDVVKYCEDNGISLRDISIDYFPEPLTHAIAAVKMWMRSLYQAMEAEFSNVVYENYLTDSRNNFRLDINPQYKISRVGKRVPHWLKDSKQFLVDTYGASYAYGMEADDMLTIRATKLENEGKLWVIASVDKDLKQIPGLHFDPVKGELKLVSTAEARERLWTQVITGDSTDSIYTPHGLGPAKAKVLFRGVNWMTISDEELMEMCTMEYCKWLAKGGKKKQSEGISPTVDFTDVRCFVEETYRQVFLLRERP